MSTKKAAGAVIKKQKTSARQVIAEKIDLALGEYKNGLDKKKYEKALKKASKLLRKLVVVSTIKETKAKKPNAKAVASIK
jgi:hypothetical protein